MKLGFRHRIFRDSLIQRAEDVIRTSYHRRCYSCSSCPSQCHARAISSMYPSSSDKELSSARLQCTTIQRSHHLFCSDRVDCQVIELKDAAQGKGQVNLGKVLPNAIPWTCAEWSRHSSHFWRYLQPSLWYKGLGIGKSIRITSSRI